MENRVKHSKHAKLLKPLGGEFHRNEIAILGAPCSIINEFAEQLANELEGKLKIAYVDAAHQNVQLQNSFKTKLIDNQSFVTIDSAIKIEQKQFRKFFSTSDLVLVNGNHFKAEHQIVIIDERKKESLERKLDRLTNVVALVLQDGVDFPFEFLLPKLKDNTPIFKICDLKNIPSFLQSIYKTSISAVNGLVLMGGKSSRMGEDKAQINYYQKPHYLYLADLLAQNCEEVFLSQNSATVPNEKYQIMQDKFLDLGPYGGLLSAFRENPNCAWLTLACDLPFVNKELLNQLFENRNPSKLATCFYNQETNFPEPLITIWEPKAYPVLLEFLSQGYSCPRKVLINTEIEMIEPVDYQLIVNANTPTERDTAKQKLAK